MHSNQYSILAQVLIAQISGEIRDGTQVNRASRRRIWPRLDGHWNWLKKLNNYLNI